MSERTIDDILSDFANATGETEALRCQGMSAREQTMRADELRAELNARFDATRRALADVTRERDFALVCSGCGSPRLSAVLACVRGQAACCPDCSTLTMDERNTIRGAVSALALDLATSRAALEEARERQLPLVRLRDEAYRQRDEARAERDEAVHALDVLRVPVNDAMEYEGRLDASLYLSVDALNVLRRALAQEAGDVQ